MECNKDEAVRAKVIAERKLTEKDYAGAKKFVLKAQTLYPGLDGLSQMLVTLEVYVAGEGKINGEVDWYGVLGVHPSDDDGDLKRQYRKLALLLHPDKNKCVGAEGAFKLLSEAWSVLSDQAKRHAYDQRRSAKGLQQKVPAGSGFSSAAPSANGHHSARTHPKPPNTTVPPPPHRRPTTVPPPQRRPTTVHPPQRPPTTVHPPRQNPNAVPPSQPESKTFWTVCRGCKMHYEYLRTYLNHTLLCPTCREAFVAKETPPPYSSSTSSGSKTQPKHQNHSHHQPKYQNPSHQAANSSKSFVPPRYAQNSQPKGSSVPFNNPNAQRPPFYTTVGFDSKPSTGSVAANIVHQVNERMKRQREELNAGSGLEKLLKKRRGLGDDSNGSGGKTASQMASGNGGASGSRIFGARKSGGFETDRVPGSSGFYGSQNSTRDLTIIEVRSMLMTKARTEIRKKLSQWNSEAVAKAVAKAKKDEVKAKEKEKTSIKGNGVSSSSKDVDKAKKQLDSTFADEDANKEKIEPVSIHVPDPDFHDFDNDRTETSFEDNQVWAAYDDDDGMPRFYAMIHQVISSSPFKMRISWLNSKSNSEFGPIEWVSCGFAKSCGILRIGKHEINKSLNSFSHKVNWTKGPRGTVMVLPRKGDVWALYRNWSPDWDELTPDEVIHKYDMVEVLEDYSEEQGVSIAPLVKVPGFRTVFRADTDPAKVRRIEKKEMFRFSHQVPNHLLTGLEAQNAPKGCQELDPAATPLELLQVMTANEADDATMEEPEEKSGEETRPSASPPVAVDEMVVDTPDGEVVEDSEEETDGGETSGTRK